MDRYCIGKTQMLDFFATKYNSRFIKSNNQIFIIHINNRTYIAISNECSIGNKIAKFIILRRIIGVINLCVVIIAFVNYLITNLEIDGFILRLIAHASKFMVIKFLLKHGIDNPCPKRTFVIWT